MKDKDRGSVLQAIVELLILGFIAAVLLLAPPVATPGDLEVADWRQAKIVAEAFCRKAKCPMPVRVEIVTEAVMGTAILAHTTMQGETCLLTFTAKTAWREDVVAHEVCHCVMDGSVIGPYGYEGLTKDEIKGREKAAGACAERLTGG